MNNTGYYRVSRKRHPTCKQGFNYSYQYYDDVLKKRKSITSIDIDELEKKVRSIGLPWRKIEDGEMKYIYNDKDECFERADKIGRKLWVNSIEAQRIMTMYDLGNSVPEIRNKINFKSRNVTESTIQSVINNVRDGNIVLSDDLPAPVEVVEALSSEDKLNRLEQRISNLEDRMSEIKADCFISAFANTKVEKVSTLDKVKSWIKL